MRKQKILVKKFKPTLLPPNGEKCYISENKIYYFSDEQKKSIFHLNPNYYVMKNDKIKYDIIQNNDFLSIYAEFDIDEILNLDNEEIIKMFFSTINIYFWQLLCDYKSHCTLNLLEDTINNNIYDFISYREKKISNKLFILPDYVIKIGDCFIDIKNKKISKDINAENINILGGLILNKNNYNWINYMKDSVTKKTLVICNPINCYIWKKKLEDKFNNICIIMKQKDIQYFKKKNIDILIINNNCFCNNDIDLDIRWKKLIVDFDTVKKDLGGKLFSIKSKFRWMKISDISDISDGTNSCMKYLTNSNNIDNIIYDNKGDIYLFENIIKNIDNIKRKRDLKISYNKIKINDIISDINSYIIENNMDINEFSLIINSMIKNTKSKNSYIKLNNKHNNIKYLNYALNCKSVKKCNICFKELSKSNSLITKCGHRFCAYCLLNSLQYKKICPNCRENIDNIEDIFITSNKIMKEKFDIIIEKIRDLEAVTIFIELSLIDFFSHYLKIKKISHTKCKGRTIEKIEQINNFNTSDNKVLILTIKDRFLLNNIFKTDNIFLTDISYDIDEYLENNLNIDYFYYGDTIESKDLSI